MVPAQKWNFPQVSRSCTAQTPANVDQMHGFLWPQMMGLTNDSFTLVSGHSEPRPAPPQHLCFTVGGLGFTEGLLEPRIARRPARFLLLGPLSLPLIAALNFCPAIQDLGVLGARHYEPHASVLLSTFALQLTILFPELWGSTPGYRIVHPARGPRFVNPTPART
jgi:hypothetical protein